MDREHEDERQRTSCNADDRTDPVAKQGDAILRALANTPRLLIGDEPTGNLDQHTADDVTAVLLDLVRRTKLAALIATHNLDLARRMDRILSLEDGMVVEKR